MVWRRANVYRFWTGFIVGLVLMASTAHGQTGSAAGTTSVTGKISKTTDSDITLMSNAGSVVVKFSADTTIRGEVPVKFSDIAAGMYVGATAEKQPDGSFRASRLHIFSEDQRGTGEGHRPLTSGPQGGGSTMTNANVKTVEDVFVQDVRGRMLTLNYKGGEINVFVPQDTPVVKRVSGDRRLLTPGSTISATGVRAEDGAIVASQIMVRAETK